MKTFIDKSTHKEILLTKELTQFFKRSNSQINDLYNSDCEIIKIKENLYLIVNSDTISEELLYGLYQDFETIGWLSVVACLSDFAAVGATPLGITMTVAQPSIASPTDRNKLSKGIQQACDMSQTHIWGGDTSSASHWIIASNAIGISEHVIKSNRIGINPQDRIYATSPLGWGNAVGFANLALKKLAPEKVQTLDQNFRPLPRLNEGAYLRKMNCPTIDTSDGLILSLDFLLEANNVGIEYNYDKSIYHPQADAIALTANVTPWIFLAGPLGEFELLFAVDQKQEAEIISNLKNIGANPVFIGNVKSEKGHYINQNGTLKKLEIEKLRNLLPEGASPEKYIQTMIFFAKENGLS